MVIESSRSSIELLEIYTNITNDTCLLMIADKIMQFKGLGANVTYLQAGHKYNTVQYIRVQLLAFLDNYHFYTLRLNMTVLQNFANHTLITHTFSILKFYIAIIPL